MVSPLVAATVNLLVATSKSFTTCNFWFIETSPFTKRRLFIDVSPVINVFPSTCNFWLGLIPIPTLPFTNKFWLKETSSCTNNLLFIETSPINVVVVLALIATPPTVDVREIAALSVPWLLVTTIVSELPTSVVNEIAEAVLSLETKATWPPKIFIFSPVLAEISIPPTSANNDIAPALVPVLFVIIIFSFVDVSSGLNCIKVESVLPSVNVWSSAKLGAINILPVLVSIETASVPVPLDDKSNDESVPVTDKVKSFATVKLEAPVASRLIAPVVSAIIPPVLESILIPPAAPLALIVIASASLSLDWMFTEEPVARISISSPAEPVALISIPPADAFNIIALISSLEDAIFTWPVVSRSTPPVPEVNCNVVSASISNCPSALE